MSVSTQLKLVELNQRSATIGEFDVAFYKPKIDCYEYQDRKAKKTKKGASFRTMLVCIQDPEQYLTAELAMRSDNLEPLTKALEKYKDGSVWRMTGTRLKSNAQQEYMHSSLKLVVDMNAANTKFASLTSLALTDVKHRSAQPRMSVADCKALQSTQRFDIIALVLECSDPRPGGPDREVRDVTLIDGSKAKDTDKLVEMKISIFSDASTSPEKEKLLQLLTDVKGTNRAVSFFAIQCKVAKPTMLPDFLASKDFFALESEGPKAERMKEEQPKLLLMGQETREMITSFSPGERKDYTQEQGIQVFVAHLTDLQVPTEVIGDISIWEIHWCLVAMPASNIESITTKDGTRLWFQTCVRDLTGILQRIWMNEESALALSGLPDKNAFIKAWQDGDQAFPIVCAIKILRTVREASDDSQTTASQSYESKKFVNYQIVQACDQPLGEAPTTANLKLVGMLKHSAHDTSSIVPAALHQIATTPVVAFEVTLDAEPKPVIVPCQQVLALIRSTKKSRPEQLGGGWKLTTEDVQCILCGDDSHHAEKKYKMSSVCTQADMASFRLDPIRGKPQFALVIISNMIGDDFIVESLQLLDNDAVQAAKNSMLVLMNLTQMIQTRDKKRIFEFTPDDSPAKARKCSQLGKAPTDTQLACYESPQHP